MSVRLRPRYGNCLAGRQATVSHRPPNDSAAPSSPSPHLFSVNCSTKFTMPARKSQMGCSPHTGKSLRRCKQHFGSTNQAGSPDDTGLTQNDGGSRWIATRSGQAGSEQGAPLSPESHGGRIQRRRFLRVRCRLGQFPRTILLPGSLKGVKRQTSRKSRRGLLPEVRMDHENVVQSAAAAALAFVAAYHSAGPVYLHDE